MLSRRHPKETAVIFGLTAGGSLGFYAYTTYMQKFLTNTSGFSRSAATEIMTIALVVFMLIQPLWGIAADRLGRKPILYVFGFGGVLVSVPVFTAISHAATPAAALGLVLAPLVLLGGYTSISGLIKAELFPAHIRTLGVALPYAVGNTLFGGTAEYVALWFKQAGAESGFYWYLTAIIGMAAIGFVMLPETRTASLIEED
jgi:MHS family alpha-ketoglutarate permease-like MFS transporter